MDFPYYFLLTKFNKDDEKVSELQRTFGPTCEDYINNFAASVMPKEFERPAYNNKTGDSDLRVCINDSTMLTWETKGARSNDAVKLGSKAEIIKKYIKIPKSNKTTSYKGIFQLVRHVDAYRTRTKFQGDMFAILSFFEAPESQGFDILIKDEAEGSQEYANYIANSKNYSPIWFLNSITAELFFSAIKQGAPVEQLLQCLIKVAPSLVRVELKEFMQKHGLKYSVKYIFESEIEDLKLKCEAMFKKKDPIED